MDTIKIRVKTETMVKTMKRASVAPKSDYKFMFEQTENVCRSGVSAYSEGTMVQAQVVFEAKRLSGSGNAAFIVGDDMAKVVNIMSELGETMEMEFGESTVHISCGSGVISLSLKDTMGGIMVSADKNTIGAIVGVDDFKAAAAKCAAFSPMIAAHGIAKGALGLKLMGKDDGSAVLRVYATDFYKGAYSDVPVKQAGFMEDVKKGIKKNVGEKEYCVFGTMLEAVIGQMEDELMQIVFNTSTMIISTNTCVYTLGVYEKNYPKDVEKVLTAEAAGGKVKISRKNLYTAISLTTVVEDKKPIVLYEEDGRLTVRDYYGKTKMAVDCEFDGDFPEIGFHAEQLRPSLSKCNCDEIVLSAYESKRPLFVFDDRNESRIFVTPVILDNVDEEENEES